MAISGVRVRVIFQYGKDSEVEQWYVPARVNYLLSLYDVSQTKKRRQISQQYFGRLELCQ